MCESVRIGGSEQPECQQGEVDSDDEPEHLGTHQPLHQVDAASHGEHGHDTGEQGRDKQQHTATQPARVPLAEPRDDCRQRRGQQRVASARGAGLEVRTLSPANDGCHRRFLLSVTPGSDAASSIEGYASSPEPRG